jgi:hypothetical protein
VINYEASECQTDHGSKRCFECRDTIDHAKVKSISILTQALKKCRKTYRTIFLRSNNQTPFRQYSVMQRGILEIVWYVGLLPRLRLDSTNCFQSADWFKKFMETK